MYMYFICVLQVLYISIPLHKVKSYFARKTHYHLVK